MNQVDEPIDLSFLKEPVVLYVTLVRFVAALWILYEPLPGLIGSILLDWLDAFVLVRLGNLSERQYDLWDKNVDWIAYAAEMTIAAQYGLFMPFMLLLFYRFMGHFMFLRAATTRFYIIFPNLFEAAFLWLVIFFPVAKVADLTEPGIPWGWLGVIFAAKILHEVVLHYVWPIVRPSYRAWEQRTFGTIINFIFFRRK